MSGQRIAMRMIIMYACWTLVTSVVSRVTSELVENRSMLENENPWILWNTSCLRFLARPVAAIEQVTPAAVPKASEASAMMMRIAACPAIAETPPPSARASMSCAVTNGIAHSSTTSPVTRNGVAQAGLPNSLSDPASVEMISLSPYWGSEDCSPAFNVFSSFLRMLTFPPPCLSPRCSASAP